MSRISAFCRAAGLSSGRGAYITKPSNMFYLTGYTGEGAVAFANGKAAIITDFRYTEQAENQCPEAQVLMTKKGTRHEDLAFEFFRANGADTVKFEDDEVTVSAYRALEKHLPGIALEPLDGVPETMRRVKDLGEVALIREACRISCDALHAILPEIHAGMTEKEVQLLLDYRMLALGADGLAFSTISAAGEHGSLPHAVPGDRVIREGEMLTLDFGARKAGYDADMTRTIAFGEPSKDMLRIYETVLRAQEECEKMLRPGASCLEVDAHARKIIDDAGYIGRFGHGLGHGVGIDIHEEPRLSYTSEAILEPGNIVTVEPGIYVPGLGGVRIENTCVITEDGYEPLVVFEKNLIKL
ncbi:MAG: aminopeptidase P family protein [Clostridia bacterium]|nr:aminopeptidase P family protein [Clostridia bacterium]